MSARIESLFRVYGDDPSTPLCTIEVSGGSVIACTSWGGPDDFDVTLAEGHSQLRELAIRLGQMADEMAQVEL